MGEPTAHRIPLPLAFLHINKKAWIAAGYQPIPDLVLTGSLLKTLLPCFGLCMRPGSSPCVHQSPQSVPDRRAERTSVTQWWETGGDLLVTNYIVRGNMTVTKSVTERLRIP